MVKKEARKLFKEKRKALTLAEQARLDDMILIRFQQAGFPYISSVLSFYPIEEHREINTFIITDYLQFCNPGLQMVYPKTNFLDHSLEAILCTDETGFQKNGYNIVEPESGKIIPPHSLDLVLIPLLAFDKNGNRVGYGKGFYDRFLQGCRKDCLKIGLNYFEAIDQIEDRNEFDVPLNFCITPQKVYVF